MFFLSSSDIFITLRYDLFVSFLSRMIRFRLRVYAITFRNKILAAYFGTLVLARLTVSLASSFVQPVIFTDLPPIPINTFGFCPIVAHLRFRLIPSAIGTAFGECLCWFYLLV